MNKLQSNQPFGTNGKDNGVISIVTTMSSGTATLQKLAGNDPDNDTWVTVANGVYSVTGEATIRAPRSQKYRMTLTGDAAAWSS